MGLAWPVAVPVPRGILVAAEQEVLVAEPSVAERADDASILLAVPVTVTVAVAVAVAVGGGLGREVRSWNVWRAVLQDMGWR